MLLLSIALASFTFPGGSPAAFANKLYEASSQPVFICQGVSAKIPKVEFDPSDANSIMAAFKNAGPTTKTPGVEMTFTDGLVDPAFLNVPVIIPGSATYGPATPSADWVKDGNVTIKLEESQSIRLGDLRTLKTSRPVSIHRSLEGFKVVVRVQDMPERDFLIKLAKISGARFRSSSKEFELTPFGPEFISRVVKTLRESSSRPKDSAGGAVAQEKDTPMDIWIACLQDLTEADLMKVLDSKEGLTSFGMPTKGKGAAAFVAWFKKSQAAAGKNPGAQQGQFSISLKAVDWAKSSFLYGTNLSVSAELVYTDPTVRQERKARFEISQSVARTFGPGGL